MNCFSKIFFSTLSQQKLMRKKFLVKQKYLLILKIKNKMKNLQEMSLEEMRQTEGGNLGLAIVLVCVLAYYMTRENDRDK